MGKCRIDIKKQLVPIARKGALDISMVKRLASSLDPSKDDVLLIAEQVYALIIGSSMDEKRTILDAETLSDVANLHDSLTLEEKEKVDAIKANMKESDIGSSKDIYDLLIAESSPTKRKNSVVTTNISHSKINRVKQANRIVPIKAEYIPIMLGGKKVGVYTFKNNRVLAAENVKHTVEEAWTGFLAAYFPGMSDMGAEFEGFAKEKLLDKIVTFSRGEGFASDINNKLNDLKQTSISYAKILRANIANIDGDLKLRLGDESIREAYFYDVLAADFDFIATTVSGLFTINTDDIVQKDNNTEIFGIVDPTIEEDSDEYSILLDLSRVPAEVIEGEIGDFDSNGALTIADNPAVLNDDGTINTDEVGINPTIMSVPTKLSFSRDALTGDISYTSADGKSYNVTKKTTFSINTKNKVNVSSIDHTVDSLDQDTDFIKNIFPIFRLISPDMTIGARLRYSDYLRIAPLLVNAGNTVDSIVEALDALARKDLGRISNVARSLMYYVFSETSPSNVAIDSLRSIAMYSDDVLTNNEKIVKALKTALTSKEQVRLIKVNGNSTSVTKKAMDRDFSYMINDSLAGSLLMSGRIKDNIEAAIVVVPDPTGVADSTVTIDVLGKKININTIHQDDFDSLASFLNIDDLFSKFKEVVYEHKQTENKANITLASMLKGVVTLAAANKRYGRLVPKKITGDLSSQTGNFMAVGATNLLLEHKLLLEEALQPDTTKQISVAGEKRASSSPINRDSALNEIITKYDNANSLVVKTPSTFNPFIKSHLHEDIIPAEYLGAAIKTPMMIDGKPVKLSKWSVKTRVEYSIIQGFLKMPKMDTIGSTFFVQPLPYSDKTAIPMHEVNVGENLFRSEDGLDNKLKNMLYRYHVEKNASLQKISLEKFAEFIGSNYSTIHKAISADVVGKDSEGSYMTAFHPRVKTLALLRNTLVSKSYVKPGDMTREINDMLDIINIPVSMAMFNNNSIDLNVDYVNMGGKLILKPTVGVRADAFLKHGKVIVDGLLKEHRDVLTKINVDVAKLAEMIKNTNYNSNQGGVKVDVETFLNRVFIINSVYGHGLKVLTMGDETYFHDYYPESSIKKYYEKADSDKNKAGQKELIAMFIKQAKRAQSNLTRGQVYMHKNTLEGMKRESAKDNILNHMHISNPLDIDSIEYSFPSLVDKDIYELEGMGLVTRVNDSLLSTDGGVVVNVGRHSVYMAFSKDMVENKALHSFAYRDSLQKLIKEAINKARISPLSSTGTRYSATLEMMTEAQPRLDGRTYIEATDIIRLHKKLHKDKMITLPDFMPSILVSDPVSFVDVMGKMNNKQENSDAIQYVHPIYDLLFKHARGSELSGFFNQAAVATKTLTTSMEYDSFRQVLQKKSSQMPFSYEQMSKLGSPEVFAMLRKMNEGITFPTTKMTVPVVNEDGVIIKNATGIATKTTVDIQNMQVLFDYFGGFKRKSDKVWEDVLMALADNAENMFSFVGLITVPSNQKTGHKKLNKWEEVFSNKPSPLNIGYMANEFNVEALTKAHEYDVSEGAAHASQLALLSQLVNAIAFGGLSTTNNLNLQNAMEGMSEISALEIGRVLADHVYIEGANNAPIMHEMHALLLKGDLGNKVFIDNREVFGDVLMRGLYDVMQNAFNEDMDSPLIKRLLIEPGVSLETPAIRNKVLGVLKSSFYKNAIQMKMSGFIGVVSAAHNTINVYNIDGTEVRRGRQGYIQHFINDAAKTTLVTKENLVAILNNVMPTDKIFVDGRVDKILAEYNIEELVKSGKEVRVVLLPEKISIIPTIEAYNKLEQFDMVRLTYTDEANKSRSVSVYKWYAEELLKGDVQGAIDKGNISKDTTEEHSLRWYILKNNTTGEDIKESDAYKAMYRHAVTLKKSKDLDVLEEQENELIALKAALIRESQKIESNGKKKYRMILPEVILPTFFSKAYNIKKGTSISDIIGTDGNELINAKAYFSTQTFRKYKPEKYTKTLYVDSLITKYSYRKATNLFSDMFSKNTMYDEILDLLDNTKNKRIRPEEINEIIYRHRDDHITRLSESLLETLKTTLTRIPGQTKQSGFAAKIVELLDAQGNATFAATEHLVNTGGDFDVDTLSVLTKSLDENGMIFDFKKFTDDTGVLNVKRLLEAYKNELTLIESEMTKSITAHNSMITIKLDKAEDAITKTEEEIMYLTDKGDVEGRVVLESKRETQLSYILSLQTKEISAEREAGLIKRTQKMAYKRAMNMLSNAMESGVHGALSDVNTSMEVQTPVTMDMFASLKAAIAKMTTDEIFNEETGELERREVESKLDSFKHSNLTMHPESYISIFVVEDLAAQGADAIGIYATVLKMSSAVQTAFSVFDHTKQIFHRDPFIFRHDLKYHSKLSGKSEHRIRTTFSDLDRFKIAEAIANNPDVQNSLEELASTGTVTDRGHLEHLENMVIEEIAKTLTELRGYSEEDINKIAVEKIKSLFGIDIMKEAMVHNSLASNGKALANEFLDLC